MQVPAALAGCCICHPSAAAKTAQQLTSRQRTPRRPTASDSRMGTLMKLKGTPVTSPRLATDLAKSGEEDISDHMMPQVQAAPSSFSENLGPSTYKLPLTRFRSFGSAECLLACASCESCGALCGAGNLRDSHAHEAGTGTRLGTQFAPSATEMPPEHRSAVPQALPEYMTQGACKSCQQLSAQIWNAQCEHVSTR